MADSHAATRAPRLKVSPARVTAFALLRELASSVNTHSDDLLQGSRMLELSIQDRHLCTALVMGVLRWQICLDAAIARLLTHKSRLDEPVSIALRMGAFQLLQMDRIPAHAAISDSVELTKRSGHTSAGGMVNAILRKVATSAAATEMKASEAHPAWMYERWRSAMEGAALSSLCAYDQQQPAMTLRMPAGALPSESKLRLQRGRFLKAAMRVEAGDTTGRELLPADGLRWQDEGSQLVAELLGGLSKTPVSILDCCAAPGGKAAILAERFPSARITAWDISASRIARMRKRFSDSERLSQIRTDVLDVVSAAITERYDLILCDVPCSGTGTLARNPEIKLRLREHDLERQHQRQVAILGAALNHLAPGGRLIYATCSLEPEENEAVIEAMLEHSPGLRILPIAARLIEMHAEGTLHDDGLEHLLQYAVTGAYLRTIPGVSPCDGFFAALLTVQGSIERQ